MTRPAPKGWCPGAFSPMMSGDGLLVRIKPRLAHLTAEQAAGLCRAAQRHGNGVIDLTNRANLQIRGVSETGHQPLLAELGRLGLLDDTPALENRRNILVAPDWEDGDETCHIAARLTERLADLPDLPAKFGFAIDTGRAPVFGGNSADIRIERSATGGLILRADGAETGLPVTTDDAVDRAIALARWFVQTGGEGARRMARHLGRTPLPGWAVGTEPPASSGPLVRPGQAGCWRALGAPFGQIDAHGLAALICNSGATAMRVTPWRVFLLKATHTVPAPAFVTGPDDPLLGVDACPGAPLCRAATVETRDLARRLATRVTGGLHVSGCAKGCARARPADLTLTGRDGRFDLVPNGHPWDAPRETGLTREALLARFGVA